jgi:hypothetical protein
MKDHGAVTDSEKRLVKQAYREAEERTCKCHEEPVKVVFTWNAIRPYYFTCARPAQWEST